MVLEATQLNVHLPTFSALIGFLIGMNFIVGIQTAHIAELLLTDAAFKLVDASVIHSMVFEVELHSESFATVLALIHLPAIMHP